jgi:hypothetical protein
VVEVAAAIADLAPFSGQLTTQTSPVPGPGPVPSPAPVMERLEHSGQPTQRLLLRRRRMPPVRFFRAARNSLLSGSCMATQQNAATWMG